MPHLRLVMSLAALLAAAGCTTDVEVDTPFEDEGATTGASVTVPVALTGCQGQAASSIPADRTYVITTFGGPGDEQGMSCGGRADSTWFYAASRQRYGCGARVAIRANGKCVVAQTDDYGPDVCVERAAGRPIMDVSPRVSQVLFGTSSAGWSERKLVTVTEVPRTTPLGPCATTPPPPPASGCTSTTLGREVAAGVCVRPASGTLFKCVAGNWAAQASTSGCSEVFDWCASATLGRSVPARTCVQSASSGAWFQCNGTRWAGPATATNGPSGACSPSFKR